MNEYRKRLEELAQQGALFSQEVTEAVVCATAVGVFVEFERLDLNSGEKTRWFVTETGDVLGRPEPVQVKRSPATRRTQKGVQVVGSFRWDVPDEIQTGPQPAQRARTQ